MGGRALPGLETLEKPLLSCSRAAAGGDVSLGAETVLPGPALLGPEDPAGNRTAGAEVTLAAVE